MLTLFGIIIQINAYTVCTISGNTIHQTSHYLFIADWYPDDWITHVYEPNHSTKVHDVHLYHTKKMGTRYKAHHTKEYLAGEILTGKYQIAR